MQRKIILTRDGSHSISIPEADVTYHSIHGAIQESTHVFIDAGLKYIQKPVHGPLYVLEMGLGTGLNVLLTLLESMSTGQTVHYTSIELHPLEQEHIQSLNYCQLLGHEELHSTFEKIHTSRWNYDIMLNGHFSLKKIRIDLQDLALKESFDLIYYDAFAPSFQPELWTSEIFGKLYEAALPGGILVTYCSKSIVQRAMKAAGWKIEKIPGPYGKREMIRAAKPEL